MRRVLLLVLILIGGPAEAALMQVSAIGYDPYYSDPNGLLPFPAPPANSAMTLTFTYDSDALDEVPDPNVGRFAGSIANMTLSIGGTTLSALPQNGVTVLNDHGNGNLTDIWFAETNLYEGPIRTEMSLSLLRHDGGAIDSDALGPPTFPAPWNMGFIYYGIRDTSDPDVSNWITLAQAQVLVDSMTVTPIPIPPAGWLSVSGLLTLARFRLQGPARSR